MRSIIQDERLRQAILQFTVNVLGVFLLFVIYLNYVLFQPYIRPLFWAVVFSVPLHSLKHKVVQYILATEDQTGLSIVHVFWLGVKMTAKLGLAELWDGSAYLLSWYLQQLHHRFTAVEKEERLVTEKERSHSHKVKERVTKNENDTESSSITPSSSLPGFSSSSFLHFKQPSHSLSSSSTSGSSSSLFSEFVTQGLSNWLQRSKRSIPSSLSSSMTSSSFEEPSTFSSSLLTNPSSSFTTVPTTSTTSTTPATSTLPLDSSFPSTSSSSSSIADASIALLLRATTLYLLYHFFLELGGSRIFVLLCCLGILFALHFSYYLCRYWYRLYFHRSMCSSLSKASTYVPWFNHLHLCFMFMVKKTGMTWMQSKYKRGKTNAKYVFIRNANSFASLFVLISVFSVGFIFTSFLMFKMIQETNQVMEWMVQSFDTLLPEDVKHRFEGIAEEASTMGWSWLEQKVNETWPGVNLTLLYTTYFTHPSSSSSSFTSTSMNTLKGQTLVPFLSNVSTPVAYMNTTMTSSFTSSYGIYNSSSWITIFHQLQNTTFLMSFLPSFLSPFSFHPNMKETFTSNSSGSSSTTMKDTLLSILIPFLTFFSSIMVFLLSSFLDFFHTIVQGSVFLIFLHMLVSQPTSVTQWLAQLLSFMDPNQSISQSFEFNLHAVLICTFKMTLFHSLFTWLTFSVFGVQLVYIPTFLTAFICLIPFFSPLWIVFIGVIDLYWHDQVSFALMLLLFHVSSYWLIDPFFFAEIPDINPTFSAFAFLLGLWAFHFEGLVIGPFVMSVLPTLMTVFTEKPPAFKEEERSHLQDSTETKKNDEKEGKEEEDEDEEMKKEYEIQMKRKKENAK